MSSFSIVCLSFAIIFNTISIGLVSNHLSKLQKRVDLLNKEKYGPNVDTIQWNKEKYGPNVDTIQWSEPKEK